MSGDFYSNLRALRRQVASAADGEDGIDSRAGLDNVLNLLGTSARRLADDLRSYPLPDNPGILYDGCEGEWEEQAFVPVRMANTRKAAGQAIPKAAKEWVLEEPGFYLISPGRRIFLAPSEFVQGDEDWRYSRCREGDPGAIEFWVVEISERRWSPRRTLGNFVRGIKTYRNYRRQGEDRWKSTLGLRIYFSPLQSLRVRLSRWKDRGADK